MFRGFIDPSPDVDYGPEDHFLEDEYEDRFYLDPDFEDLFDESPVDFDEDDIDAWENELPF